MIPVAAEVPVMHKSHILGTALDMVCRKTSLDHAVISLKTGECQQWPPNVFMKPPLDTIPLNPSNVNQLQSMAEIELLRQDGIVVSDYRILYVNERLGIRMEKLSPWARDPVNQRKVLDAILAFKSPRKKKKKTKTKLPSIKLASISKKKKKKSIAKPRVPKPKPARPITKEKKAE
jgi:hypothetical protein